MKKERKETEKYNRIKQYVSSEIMKPIRIRIEQQKAEENKGKKLTPVTMFSCIIVVPYKSANISAPYFFKRRNH